MKTPVFRLFYGFYGLIFLLFFAPYALAQEWQDPPQNKLLEIPPRISLADLTGDGKPETIFKSLRENFNAHSYFVTIFALSSFMGGDGQNVDDPSIIGIETEHEILHELISSDYYECNRHENRLIFSHKNSILITASRNPVDKTKPLDLQGFCG